MYLVPWIKIPLHDNWSVSTIQVLTLSVVEKKKIKCTNSCLYLLLFLCFLCFSWLPLLTLPVTSSQSTAPSVTLAPVLILTVTNGRHKIPWAPRHRLNGGVILRLQLQGRAAATQTLADVLPRPWDPKPAAHDDPAHCRAIQHIAYYHIGHWAVMPLSNCLQGDKKLLKQVPTSPGVDHVLVLWEWGGVELHPLTGLRLPQITLHQKTTSYMKKKWKTETEEGVKKEDAGDMMCHHTDWLHLRNPTISHVYNRNKCADYIKKNEA